MVADISLKQELTVLGPDASAQKPLNWVVREYMGCEVFLHKGLRPEQDEEGRWKGLEPIKNREGLKPGDSILVTGLVGDLFVMKVIAMGQGSGQAVAYNEKGEPCLQALLKFGSDDRQCWVCEGLVNTRGVKALELTSG